MAEVKWIRLNTDMFDNAKIKFLRRLPEGDKIVLFWVMLLTKAGKCNSNGYIFLTESIPYTPDMLSAEFDIEVSVIELALSSLNRLNMISLEEHTLFINGWEEHQNAEGLDKIREQTRKRVAKYREKQKLISSNVTCNVTVMQSNGTDRDIEREVEIEIDRDREVGHSINKDLLEMENVESIVEAWNSLGLSRIKSLHGNRAKELKGRLKEHGEAAIIEAIENIKKSSFLKGQNKTGWRISFDWLLKPNNFTKVLEDTYRDKEGKHGQYTESITENKKWNYTISECELTDEDRRRAEDELL